MFWKKDELKSKYKSTKKILDKVSPSFCIAKWKQVSIHLHLAKNHSCHHPNLHTINLDEIENNPSALHNTRHKKNSRREMLAGIKTQECSYCWEQEEISNGTISDRFKKSETSWAMPFLEEVLEAGWSKDIDPSYLEVSFSNQCQLACVYCSANFSSTIENQQLKSGLLKDKVTPDPVYYTTFWQWLKQIHKTLLHFRITGGEPFLHPELGQLHDFFLEHDCSHLIFSINSNLSLPTDTVRKGIAPFFELKKKSKLKKLSLFTSIDGDDEIASKIRKGLNTELFWNNIEFLLFDLNLPVVIMVSFGNQSIGHFEKLISKVVKLRERGGEISISINILRSPSEYSLSSATMEKRLLWKSEYSKILLDSDRGKKLLGVELKALELISNALSVVE